MKTDEPKKIFLKDYQSPDFTIEHVDLHFDIQEDFCRVTSVIAFRKLNSMVQNLVLDGEEITLESVAMNGKKLNADQFQLRSHELEVLNVPAEFTLKTVVTNLPLKNTSLEGLYNASGVLCTQCEAQGFRKITYYLDRPDVMSKFQVRIEADEKKYPVLLSNGDLISKKSLGNGRHQTEWKDPFKKPCYLFALVAGNLGKIEDQFITMSGRPVKLEIYSRPGSQDRCWHAMESLKKSMAWDETRFGREYDLNTFMIVAADDFNAGAMENKGLNIFNSRLVLADAQSATDDDYFSIESVVAHEYFHNWTGNRVTLRDWFHLSLKEGLTVFRDQEFSMDMGSRSGVRIDSVTDLRSRQFQEDAGPSAHPIRPESGFAVDNFFTPTIYEKGAEVIRMMQTMVGRPGFRKGMDLYFERHDGQAVIIEDFAKAIADANGQTWEQFKLWFSQAGTPQVKVSESYNQQKSEYHLQLEQSCAATPGQPSKSPFHIPLLIGLLDADGKEIEIRSSEIKKNSENQDLLHLFEAKKNYTFTGIKGRPVLSLNRQFSAPIHLNWAASEADLLHLLSHDSDDFNRWEAGQKLFIQASRGNHGVSLVASPALLSGLKKSLTGPLDPLLKAMILNPPSDSFLLQLQTELDAPALEASRRAMELEIAQSLNSNFVEIYQQYHGRNDSGRSPKDFAERRLKNLALKYLTLLDFGQLALAQFKSTKIMTDQQAALSALVHQTNTRRTEALELFQSQWKNDALVMNKWFALQASSTAADTFKNVVALWDHPDFNCKNPNRVYSLLVQFGNNLVRFHDPTQDCYSFMTEKIIELDRLNPQVATRVSSCFNPWKKLTGTQKQKAHQSLERLIASGLSKNTYEIVSKALAE